MSRTYVKRAVHASRAHREVAAAAGTYDTRWVRACAPQLNDDRSQPGRRVADGSRRHADGNDSHADCGSYLATAAVAT
eukprot:4657568-Prymnesium_polylepis.1